MQTSHLSPRAPEIFILSGNATKLIRAYGKRRDSMVGIKRTALYKDVLSALVFRRNVFQNLNLRLCEPAFTLLTAKADHHLDSISPLPYIKGSYETQGYLHYHVGNFYSTRFAGLAE